MHFELEQRSNLLKLKVCHYMTNRYTEDSHDKSKVWNHKVSATRKFLGGHQAVVLATSKSHKMATNWLGPGIVMVWKKITSLNCKERNNSIIYHVILMISYSKRLEFVSLFIYMDAEKVKEDAKIPILRRNSHKLICGR